MLDERAWTTPTFLSGQEPLRFAGVDRRFFFGSLILAMLVVFVPVVFFNVAIAPGLLLAAAVLFVTLFVPMFVATLRNKDAFDDLLEVLMYDRVVYYDGDPDVNTRA